MAGRTKQNSLTLWWDRLTKAQRIALIVIVALIVVGLAIGIPVGVHQHNEQVERQQFEQRYERLIEAQEDCEQLETVKLEYDQYTNMKLKASSASLTIYERDYTDVSASPEGSLYQCVLQSIGAPGKAAKKIFHTRDEKDHFQFAGDYLVGWNFKDGYITTFIHA